MKLCECGKVMLSQTSVCSQGGDRYITCIGHMAEYPSDIRPWTYPLPSFPPLMTSGSHHWRPVKIGNLKTYPSPTGTDI